jgi:CHAT domain-containing protein
MSTLRDVPRSWMSPDSADYTQLPFTRQEATRLLALSPKHVSFGATDFQANRATCSRVELSQYRYVHFATHGVLDAERPGLSSLVLSLVDAQGKAQDGFLRAHDIYNLKLPAELVVLSACQTGLGKEIKGEGLVGLTRGFMYAGAARVVVSLWNVNDKATAELMTKFYEKMLKQGAPGGGVAGGAGGDVACESRPHRHRGRRKIYAPMNRFSPKSPRRFVNAAAEASPGSSTTQSTTHLHRCGD